MCRRARRIGVLSLLTTGMLVWTAERVAAQDRVGGHFGFVLPLFTRAQGETTTISDDFVIGFPTGVTVRKSDTFAFDLEVVPVVQNDPLHVDLTIHPGVVWGVGNGIGAGVRIAFDVNKPSWGFTPILNKGLLEVGRGSTLFAELVVPIRFQEGPRLGPTPVGATTDVNFTSIGVGLHIGVGF